MAHPVLDSVLPVVRSARDVSIDLDRLAEHAGWLAYEELPPPEFLLPFPLELDRDGIVDFVLTATSINFAFTDLGTRTRWEVEHEGRVLADADGMLFCLQRALAEGVPVLDALWPEEPGDPILLRLPPAPDPTYRIRCRSASDHTGDAETARARRKRRAGLRRRDARFQGVRERLAHRLELDPVEHVLEEAANDQALGLRT